jgi:hypothetical protein
MNVFGFTDADWSAAKAQARTAMIEALRGTRTISYPAIVARISGVCLEPRDKRLDGLLDEISTDEDAAGRGMLSVVVVHKTGDLQPGPGFFELAGRLGRYTTDALKFWAEEFERVRAAWSSPQRVA